MEHANPLALAAGYSSSDSDEETAPKQVAAVDKTDGGRDGPDNDSADGHDAGVREEATEEPVVGKKRPLPRASDLMSTKITPAFIAHTVASKQGHTPRLAPVKLDERPIPVEQKKRGLLEAFEEKRLKAKAVSSKYHVPASERSDFVEPTRERKKPAKESGDIGWYEVFARRSKRSSAEAYADQGPTVCRTSKTHK
jgi:hypothetical protein